MWGALSALYLLGKHAQSKNRELETKAAYQRLVYAEEQKKSTPGYQLCQELKKYNIYELAARIGLDVPTIDQALWEENPDLGMWKITLATKPALLRHILQKEAKYYYGRSDDDELHYDFEFWKQVKLNNVVPRAQHMAPIRNAVMFNFGMNAAAPGSRPWNLMSAIQKQEDDEPLSAEEENELRFEGMPLGFVDEHFIFTDPDVLGYPVPPGIYDVMKKEYDAGNAIISIFDDYRVKMREAEYDCFQYWVGLIKARKYPDDFGIYMTMLKWCHPAKVVEEYSQYVYNLNHSPDLCWENERPYFTNDWYDKISLNDLATQLLQEHMDGNRYLRRGPLAPSREFFRDDYADLVVKKEAPLDFYDWCCTRHQAQRQGRFTSGFPYGEELLGFAALLRVEAAIKNYDREGLYQCWVREFNSKRK